MKSILALCSIVGAVADVSECQADESTLLQGRHVRRKANFKTSQSHDAKAILQNMRDVANSLVEGSDTALSEDVILDAFDQAIEPLAELSAAVLARVENAQQSITDAHAAFRICRAPDSGEREFMEGVAARADGCHDTLNQLQTAETQQCDTAEDCLCDEARIRTAEHQALCTQMTESYEEMFCVQHGRCTDAQECHSGAAEVYERLTADVEQEMRLIEEEYTAVEQSLCIQRLGREAMTPPRTPIPPADLTACDVDVDVSALSINYPAAPAAPPTCPAHRHGDPGCVAALAGYEHEPGGCIRRANIAVHNGDYTPEQCAQICDAVPRCRGFHYVPPDTPTPTRRIPFCGLLSHTRGTRCNGFYDNMDLYVKK